MNRKLTRLEKLKAAKAVSEYCLSLWENTQKNTLIMTENNNGDSLADILHPWLGACPAMSDPTRTYWMAVKCEILKLAYEDYLKSQLLWIQSIPFNGVQIRDRIPIRENSKLISNIRRMVNHALELNESLEYESFLPLDVKIQYQANRDFQLQLFLSIQETIEINNLELDFDTQEIFKKLKGRVQKYFKL